MKIHWFFKVLFVAALTILLWVSFYFGLPAILPVQNLENTQVYGLIFSDQVWGGEIRVVGDIYSPTSSTITVLPGTKIIVAVKGDKSNMDFLPWHRKSGINTRSESRGVRNGEPFWDEKEKIQIHLNNLVILGESGNPVELRSDATDSSAYGFNLLKINKGRISNALFSNYRRFESRGDLIVNQSIFKDTGECSLCIYSGRPKIYNNTFESSARESIFIDRASPQISNNLFINLIGDGIRVDSRRLSVVEITKNNFEMPKGNVINIISGGELNEGLIGRNIFSGGSSLINIACDSRVKIRDNVILGQVKFSTGCNGSFIFGPNFWGTPATEVILREKILNKSKAFSVEIPNVLLSPPKEAGRR